LALKLLEQKKLSDESKKKKKQDGSLLADDRFRALFENTDFEVDTKTEDFRFAQSKIISEGIYLSMFILRLINPVLAKSVNKKSKKSASTAVAEEEEEDDLSSSDGHDDSSSDEDNAWAKELQRQHKLIKREKLHREMVDAKKAQPKMFELKSSEDFEWNKRRNFKDKK